MPASRAAPHPGRILPAVAKRSKPHPGDPFALPPAGLILNLVVQMAVAWSHRQSYRNQRTGQKTRLQYQYKVGYRCRIHT
jgi:hypothetical protein